ncbi:spore germination protein [Ornithinibacillus scapharcae]|uniref:spore germination protein n=1 Tax=Ornithinibacillus scapharcae TaxID=1147159 RepID=UPI000225BD46|nr:spore germination protein [Ornithinibacillus scapharcae]
MPTEDVMYLDKLLHKGSLTIEELKNYLANYADIVIYPNTPSNQSISFYLRGMTDNIQINDYYRTIMTKLKSKDGDRNSLDLPPLYRIGKFEDVMSRVFSGYLIFYKEGDHQLYALNAAKVPQRTPEESSTEIAIKGPKDGFTEELDTNVSLIRKRLNTEYLYNETFQIGSLSNTSVSLLYLHHKASLSTIEEARQRLQSLQVESVISSGQLEQWISDKKMSLFPLYDSSGRVDFAVECLLKGRFIIVVNGSPTVLIGPVNIFSLLKSPEDIHYPYYLVAFQRVFRLFSLLIAIFLPGFWISIASVNIDLIPFNLLATVVEARRGMPLPFFLEFLFLLALFEILREAGIRMPKPVGQTIAVVGGLIIGDALIRAGLASATLIVVIALSTVATYTLVNQSIIGTVTIIRLYMVIISGLLGIYGFLLGVVTIVVYLSRLESYSLSYVEPVVSFKFNKILSIFLISPIKVGRQTGKQKKGEK